MDFIFIFGAQNSQCCVKIPFEKESSSRVKVVTAIVVTYVCSVIDKPRKQM